MSCSTFDPKKPHNTDEEKQAWIIAFLENITTYCGDHTCDDKCTNIFTITDEKEREAQMVNCMLCLSSKINENVCTPPDICLKCINNSKTEDDLFNCIEGNGMATWLIIVIVIASVVAVGLIIGLSFYFYKKKHKNNNNNIKI